MKAALLKDWNKLEITEIKKPNIKDEEALIKVIYGGLCGSDVTVFQGLHPTAVVPVVPCHEILGIIEKLPHKYDGPFSVGDRVIPNPVISCKECYACKSGFENICTNLKLLGIHNDGGFAEYTVASAERLVKIDPSLTNETAVLGEPFAVGYHVNKRAGIKYGDKMLIIGAGVIGIVTAIVAKEMGAQRVVISEINTERLGMAKSLGIEIINPAVQNLKSYTKEATEGVGFDVVCDTSGSKAVTLMLPDLCRVRGALISLVLSGITYEFPIGKISFKEMTLIGSRLYSQNDFENGMKIMKALADRYNINSLVTNIMPLSQTEKAFEYMMLRKNVGKIVIDCGRRS